MMNAVRKYMSSLRFVISLGVLITGVTTLSFSQTAPNTQITNTANAHYQYKFFPKDSVNSNTVLFSVLDAPNFEMSISNPDSFVFARETVTVRIVYKNVGNASADSASIEGILTRQTVFLPSCSSNLPKTPRLSICGRKLTEWRGRTKSAGRC